MSDHRSWLLQLSDSPSSERGAVLTSLVSSALRGKLLMSDSDSLPVDKSYFELGLTSLGAVELQEDLEKAINRRINATSLYNNPTIDNLTAYLRNEVLTDYFVAPVTRNDVAEDAGLIQQNTSEYTGSAKNLLDEMLNNH